jgi:dihydrofolate reductase
VNAIRLPDMQQKSCIRGKDAMSKVRVAAFSVSLDGFGAGARQDLQNPLGVRGTEAHEWFFQTETFKKIQGQSGITDAIKQIADSHSSGTRGIDSDIAAESFENVGAWILGRNMFGPVRGPWKDESWKGWWGTNPPFHAPVFVLTHYARAPLQMDGETTFYFVTDGIESALKKAKEAARQKEVRIGGGVSLIRQYLAAGLIDEMHLAFAPVLLGEGEQLFNGMNLRSFGFAPFKTVMGENAMHVFLRR